MGRKPFVGGNWKCNGNAATIDMMSRILADAPTAQVEIVIAPPALHLLAMRAKLPDAIGVAGQNCSQYGNGAFTGEHSAEMLAEAGVPFVILGHSERRHKFGEEDSLIASKVEIAVNTGLTAIVCVGETLEDREGGKTIDVVNSQVRAFAPRVNDWGKIVIAYEPVWAIGTGKVATAEQAQEAHVAIRKCLAEAVGEDVAQATRIIYGGSVSPKNCGELAQLPDVDGFLVGGASLKPDFAEIVKSKAQ